MGRQAAGERAAEQFAHQREAEALVLAEGAQRAHRLDDAVLRVGRRLAVIVERLARRETLALVVRDARLALRDHAQAPMRHKWCEFASATMQLPCCCCARDAERHGLVADGLAEAGLAVEREQRAAVEPGQHGCVGLQAAFEKRVRVARQHAHAVRIVAGEVGLDQVVGDELDFARRAAEALHQLVHRSTQALDRDRVDGCRHVLCSCAHAW